MHIVSFGPRSIGVRLRCGGRHRAPAGRAASSAAAARVAYSRVHPGVHYPSDAIAGSVIGAGLAPAVVAALDRRRAASLVSA
ncbi:MAG: phosphatase PAP2 family protein [Solirubrobacteraceae bacterium]